MDPTDITRSMENSYGGHVDIDIRGEVQLFGWLQSYLMLKKFMNKHFKVWYFNVLCDVRW